MDEDTIYEDQDNEESYDEGSVISNSSDDIEDEFLRKSDVSNKRNTRKGGKHVIQTRKDDGDDFHFNERIK